MMSLSKRLSACGCCRGSKHFAQTTCFFKHAICSISVILQNLTDRENELTPSVEG